MDKAFGTRDSEWSFVEVEISEEAGMGREFGLTSGRLEVIQGDVALWKETIPFAKWEIGVAIA